MSRDSSRLGMESQHPVERTCYFGAWKCMHVGLVLEDLMCQLASKRIDVKFRKLTRYTKKMEEVYEHALADTQASIP